MTINKERGSIGAWVLALVVIALVIWAMYYFTHAKTASVPITDTSPAPSSEMATSTDTAVTSSAPVQNLTMNVSIQNFAFNPSTLTVKAGTTVTWTNEDSMAHTVTSDTGSTLNSARLAQGQSYSVTFTQPGTYAYHCSVHSGMKGTVVVQ